MLGGRVAEEIIFSEITTGAAGRHQAGYTAWRAPWCASSAMSQRSGPSRTAKTRTAYSCGRGDDAAPSGLLGRDRPRRSTRKCGSSSTRSTSSFARRISPEPQSPTRPLGRGELPCCENASTQKKLPPAMEGRPLPERQRVIIPTWSERRRKERRRGERSAAPSSRWSAQARFWRGLRRAPRRRGLRAAPGPVRGPGTRRLQ